MAYRVYGETNQTQEENERNDLTIDRYFTQRTIKVNSHKKVVPSQNHVETLRN
jgi:hypothetical protein